MKELKRFLRILRNKFSLSYFYNYILGVNVHSKSLKGIKSSVMKGTIVDSESAIGSYCYIGRNCNITKSNVGSYSSIANNVSIGQGEHDLELISTNSLFYCNAFEQLTMEECCLAEDVWVGTDAVIRRGVKIGRGAVIGANSVVTKDVPPYAIFAGVPAKLIRFRFSLEKIANIEKSEWWKCTPSEAKIIFNTTLEQK